VILFKFVFSNIEGVGNYLKELDVLAPSFALAMILGYIVSKIYPPRAEALKMIKEIDAELDEK
jgi:sodium/proline symporter